MLHSYLSESSQQPREAGSVNSARPRTWEFGPRSRWYLLMGLECELWWVMPWACALSYSTSCLPSVTKMRNRGNGGSCFSPVNENWYMITVGAGCFSCLLLSLSELMLLSCLHLQGHQYLTQKKRFYIWFLPSLPVLCCCLFQGFLSDSHQKTISSTDAW